MMSTCNVTSVTSGNKNKHIEHVEDEILNHGYTGACDAYALLESVFRSLCGNAAVNLTTKWDGSPSIVCGTDPISGRFFIGTKGVFANTPKQCFTVDDIRRHHPSVSLQQKLQVALKYLQKLDIDGIIQGDLMWTTGGLSAKTINGTKYVTFKPNTLTYAVPADSELAATMVAAKAGIVFHTWYSGDTLKSMVANYEYDASQLTYTPDVWASDCTINNLLNHVVLSNHERAELEAALANTKQLLDATTTSTFDWLSDGINQVTPEFVVYIKAHINAVLRDTGGFVTDPAKFAKSLIERYRERMVAQIDKYKTQVKKDECINQMHAGIELLTSRECDVKTVYALYLQYISVKKMLLHKLARIPTIQTFITTDSGQYASSTAEGFVATTNNKAIKLVDRAEFSAINFRTGTPST